LVEVYVGSARKAMKRANNINPAMLVWARETAGYTLEEAAGKLRLFSSGKGTAEDKLRALEAGDVKPTRQQLMKISEAYRRPLTAFYRNNPPPKGERGEDFRTLQGGVSRQEDGLLEALLRDIRVRQDLVKSLLEDDEDFETLPFIGAVTIHQGISHSVDYIRQLLGVDDVVSLQHGKRTPDEFFSDLRNRVEALGVFVVLAGNLGSHHSNISERVFRGFAISDEIAPFIVINDQDAKAARSFTLIHEFAHILLGASGVSATPVADARTDPLAIVERFCNDVAGEFLLPESTLSRLPSTISELDIIETIVADISSRRKISEAMVAYRFWRTGRISVEAYRELASRFAARWQRLKQQAREERQPDQRGPSYYTVRKHKLGNALIELVNRTLRANELTHTKAAKMLGVSTSSVEPLLRRSVSVLSRLP